MDSDLVKRLLQLNRNFYSQFSADFSDSRSSARFNIEPFRKYLANGMRLLDAGCGNGRLAETLDDARFALAYVGIDASAELIAFAEKRRAALQNVRAEFRVVDLTAPRWSETLRDDTSARTTRISGNMRADVSDAAPFDVIVSLAVLHHIPSFELRVQVLQEIRALLKPRGIFILSNWQFLNNERLRKKIVPWEKLEIGNWKLELGDYLLDWKRGGVGYRYVHLIDQDEVERLARASDFHVDEQFLADADLNLFSVLLPKRFS